MRNGCDTVFLEGVNKMKKERERNLDDFVSLEELEKKEKIHDEKATVINTFAKESEVALIPMKDFEKTKIGKFPITTGVLEREFFKIAREKFGDKINVDHCVWYSEAFCHNKIKGSVRKHELWRVLTYEGKIIIKVMDSEDGVSVCAENESKRWITCENESDIKVAAVFAITMIIGVV